MNLSSRLREISSPLIEARDIEERESARSEADRIIKALPKKLEAQARKGSSHYTTELLNWRVRALVMEWANKEGFSTQVHFERLWIRW